MLHHRTGASLLVAALTSGTLAIASPTAPAIRVSPALAPPATDAALRAALRESVRRNLNEADLGPLLRAYVISPSLVQLQRAATPDGESEKLVCIIDLALNDQRGVLLASVRGRVTAFNATVAEALDAAARSAVRRVPEAVRAVERAQKRGEPLAQR